MVDSQERFGSTLMNLQTKRPPDLARTHGQMRFILSEPREVAREIARVESGARLPIQPFEAAKLLWSSPVAAFLDGTRRGWLSVPGVEELISGWEALDEATVLPESQGDLQDFISAANKTTWALISAKFLKSDVIQQLNDLVLLFKFAALGKSRPLRDAANLYRLMRALTDAPVGLGKFPSLDVQLKAPLEVPSVFTSPREPAAPGPAKGSKAARRGPTPAPPRVDLSDPRVSAKLRVLEEALSELERLERAHKVLVTIKNSSLSPETSARLKDSFDMGDATEMTTVRNRADTLRNLLTRGGSATSNHPKFASVEIGGIPVLFNTSEQTKRSSEARSRAGQAIREQFPRGIVDRLRSLSIEVEDLVIFDDLVRPRPARRTPSYLVPAGRNDLLLVRQTTTGYRRAEIAYIENVLTGEIRSRKHTSRILAQEELTSSFESESEETKDLQVTDRSQISAEVEEVVKENLRAEGNFKVTSRGPTVEVSASAELLYDHSTEEASKAAESYARETVDRAIKRSVSRTKEASRRLFEQETVEVNEHSLGSADSKEHIFGVYQYLERVSRARIYWYGERELYDVLVPEPSALTWSLAASRKELGISVLPPNSKLFDELTLENLHNRLEEVVREFRVIDLPVYPVEGGSLDIPVNSSSNDSLHTMNDLKQIPAGYVVTGATFNLSAQTEDDNADSFNGGVVIGNQFKHFFVHYPNETHQASANDSFIFDPPLPGPTVGIALHAENFRSFVGNIYIETGLTDEAKTGWAIDAYAKVAARFEQQRREYEQALREARAFVSEEALLPTGSRQRLERIIRSELQRGAIDIMRNSPVDFDLIEDFPYSNADGTSSGDTHPVVDLEALVENMPEIQFLQQAFEWEHLSWILYPYFWGQRSEWRQQAGLSHPDPDFNAFLNAGMARLQIPVRPGFEMLVRHYMETLEVYEGDGLPSMGDEGYIPFIDEQATTLGEPGDEIPWPPDNPREWDVIAPTPLVLAREQAESRLPSWDPSSGSETNN